MNEHYINYPIRCFFGLATDFNKRFNFKITKTEESDLSKEAAEIQNAISLLIIHNHEEARVKIASQIPIGKHKYVQELNCLNKSRKNDHLWYLSDRAFLIAHQTEPIVKERTSLI